MKAWIVTATLAALAAAAVPPAPAPQTAAATNKAPAPTLDDRVGALIEAGKCGQAKAEATRGGNEELARQVGDMCGAKPSSSPARGAAGGSKRGGSGRGSGGGPPGADR